jgi:hypothetical protein
MPSYTDGARGAATVGTGGLQQQMSHHGSVFEAAMSKLLVESEILRKQRSAQTRPRPRQEGTPTFRICLLSCGGSNKRVRKAPLSWAYD